MPYNYNQLQSAKVVFWQKYNDGPSKSRPLPIVKELAQCSDTDVENELSVTLIPEETSRFSDKRKAYVQLIATTIDGIRFASDQHMLTIYPIQDEGVYDENVLPTPSNNDESSSSDS